MPKKPVRVPAARAGRNVRWTLEVSAEGAKESAKARQVSAKRSSKPRGDKPRGDKPSKTHAGPAAKTRSNKIVAGPAPRGPAYTTRPHITQATPAQPKPQQKLTQTPPAPSSSEPWRPRQPSTPHWPQVIAVGAAAVVVLAALAITREPGHSPSVDLSAAPASQAASEVAESIPRVLPAARRERPVPAPDALPQPRSGDVAPARGAEHPRAVAAPEAVLETASTTPVATMPVSVAPVSAVPVPASPGNKLTPSESAVSITGCLEASSDGDEFRLTDTDGDEVPKARGWRSGFLKRRPAPVALIAAPDPVGLRKFVGHRVTATGLLADREMRVRSFRSAGTLCD